MRLKVLASVLVVAGVTAGLALGGSQPRLDLLGPDGHAYCDGTTASGSPGDWGFAVFNSPSSGTLSVLVSLKNAEPDSSYAVFLVQTPGECYKGIDGWLTTNAEGNGSVRITAPSLSGSAWVSAFGAGGVEQEFVTEVYEH